MKKILGTLCLILGVSFYVKPDIVTNNIHTIFGTIYILLGNLFLNTADKQNRWRK